MNEKKEEMNDVTIRTRFFFTFFNKKMKRNGPQIDTRQAQKFV
jgi:hypothetical protein